MLDMQELHLASLPVSLTTGSPEETEAVGAAVAHLLETDRKAPAFIAMYGDLGVGKTAFVRGLASVLAPGRAVRSPTFALVNEYRCSDRREKKVCHFDMYRISGEDDLYSIGFYDYLDARNICIAEWCELIPFALPESYIKVEIKKVDLENKRNIFIGLV